MSRGRIKQLKRLLNEGNSIMDYLVAENMDLKQRVKTNRGTIKNLSQRCADFAERECILRENIKEIKGKKSFKNKLKKIFK